MSDAAHPARADACEPEMRDAALAALRALGGEGRIDAIRACVLANRGHVADAQLLRTLTTLRREGLVHDLPCAQWALAPLSYEDYLHTPEWLRTRAAALERAGDHCALDGRHRTHVEVYHRTRERLGSELDADLVVLCRSCRVLYHRAYGLARTEPAAADGVNPQAVAPDRTTGRVRRAVARLSHTAGMVRHGNALAAKRA